MSDYERWVRPAVQAVLAANYGPGDGTTEALIAGDMRIALATVGPLIAEDTRERMVAAAGRALELDASHKTEGLYYCATSDEIEQYPGGGFDVCCELGPAAHEPISEVAFCAVWKQATSEVAAAITKAGEERSPDRHHKDEEKRDHGSIRYASYLDAARIARGVGQS